VELHIRGTAFLLKDSYTLSNPNVRASYDPKCQRISTRKTVGSGKENRRRAHGGSAGGMDNTTDAELAAARTPVGRKGPHYQHKDDSYGVSTTLPDTVWTGWAYVFKGYFNAISMDKMRTVGSGTFELVWPTERVRGAPDWSDVAFNDLPNQAMLIKKPYTATLRFWDSDKKESKAGYREEHRHD
jgi:hypothetical protein